MVSGMGLVTVSHVTAIHVLAEAERAREAESSSLQGKLAAEAASRLRGYSVVVKGGRQLSMSPPRHSRGKCSAEAAHMAVTLAVEGATPLRPPHCHLEASSRPRPRTPRSSAPPR